MAATDIAICNLALSYVGDYNITSLSDDDAPSQQCALWYDIARKLTLSSLDWNFARVRGILLAHEDEPPEGEWYYRYIRPTACLKLRFIENLGGLRLPHHPFVIEGDSILTDIEDAIAVYTADISTTTKFPVEFEQTLAVVLASRLAYPLTKKRTLAVELEEIANLYSWRMGAMNMNEEIPNEPPEASYISGRQ